MKNTNLTFFDTIIYPGESSNLALPLPDFYSCASFRMPIKVIHGKEAGPCLLIFSAVKGDELNGMEIINRLLKSKQLKNLRGTLIAIPVMNVLGLINHPKASSPETNLEGCFPGKQQGTYGERTAHLVTQEILSKANYCIELQTGSLNHDILPQIYCNLDNPDSKSLAKQFTAPVITNLIRNDNSLRQTVDNLNIPFVMYQAGEAMRLNESAISLGLTGIQNVMVHLGMLDEETTFENNAYKSIFSQEQDWLRAHLSGVLHTEVELGQMIRKKQILGLISDPFSSDAREPVKSPSDGIVVGINRHPLIHEGQTLFKIASFIDNDRAETTIEAWSEILEAK